MSAFPSASRTEASAPSLAAAKDITIEAEAAQLLPVWRYHPETGKPIETQMRWGLILHDADRRPDFRPIHARAESIAEKRIFAGAYGRRRCVVPMTHFYLKDGRGKRHTISLLTREPFGVAGIWENWKDPETSRWERTFAIVTVPANTLLAPIHDRMPAILNPTDFPRWMGGEPDPRDLLKPFTTEELDVSPGLGKPRRR